MAEINLNYDPAELIKKDLFPRHLGVDIIKVSPGYAEVTLKIEENMTNIHSITHGGVVFTLADVALGLASNARGQTAVAVNVNISYIKASHPGDILIATAEEEHLGRRMANYRITVKDDKDRLVAVAQGLVYRKK